MEQQATNPYKLNASIRVIKHKDVLGKDLYYMQVYNDRGDMHMINIGLKTHDTIDNLMKPDEQQAKLFVEEPIISPAKQKTK